MREAQRRGGDHVALAELSACQTRGSLRGLFPRPEDNARTAGGLLHSVTFVVGLKAFLLVAAALAALLLALAWRFQERVVWQPPRGPHAEPRVHPRVRRVDYTTDDGQPLFGYL